MELAKRLKKPTLSGQPKSKKEDIFITFFVACLVIPGSGGVSLWNILPYSPTQSVIVSHLAEIFKVTTVAVLVPLAVFSANWIHRSRMGYSQTASADFVLAVIIFDVVVVLTSQEFEPFLRSPELRPIIGYWHFTIAFIAGLIWAGILKFGEPPLAAYYEGVGARKKGSFPAVTFVFCWMAILILIALHVGFFVIQKGDVYG